MEADGTIIVPLWPIQYIIWEKYSDCEPRVHSCTVAKPTYVIKHAFVSSMHPVASVIICVITGVTTHHHPSDINMKCPLTCNRSHRDQCFV